MSPTSFQTAPLRVVVDSRNQLYKTNKPIRPITFYKEDCHYCLNGGRRIRTFEAIATDLQSAPFGHSGTPPKTYKIDESRRPDSNR
ncbi:protein of unknown function [Petrocella atlantisensis]|uniref:Uncharacterized protein n=1 Tax=Petrocella atlantisensis TaxID=2173034 RepID=A0A3P7P2K5_9FIRM|nr:protein of unknown function [Petrocella atlantisensis]